MRDFPYDITARFKGDEFQNLLEWLRLQGHELNQTVKLGKNHHDTQKQQVTLQVGFKEPEQAILFKLAWGGET